MTLVDGPAGTAGEVVEAVIEITDVDNDGILGKATLGSATFDILGAGRRILSFPKGTPVGATLGVTVTDGYDTTRLYRHAPAVAVAALTLVRSTFRAWVQ